MKWTLRDRSQDYEIILHRDPLLQFGDANQAVGFLRRFLPDPGAMRVLRAVLQETGGAPVGPGDEEVVRRLGPLLASGKLRLGTRAEASGVGPETGEGRASCRLCPLEPIYPVRWKEPSPQLLVKKSPPPQDRKKKPEKTWIEIKLLDEAGEPVADARYEITLPDGSVKKGKLNKKGTARVEGIDPGGCSVHFPDLNVQINAI